MPLIGAHQCSLISAYQRRRKITCLQNLITNYKKKFIFKIFRFFFPSVFKRCLLSVKFTCSGEVVKPPLYIKPNYFLIVGVVLVKTHR
ncbi:hypothetical protein AB205_0207580 [Aquarana catesbeiana]|uniref:Uncharacterized protein n=1 Tax=Aquarana catesbeiana TaxID=8400 RepID=A0A2G9S1F5_AQUCT|nr:hypothetical protein AB205_0207580 [Aquarana catesbeiana]